MSLEDAMRNMTWIGLALAASVIGSPALPQDAVTNDFDDLTVPDLGAPREDREYDVCPDREPRPAWLETLGVADSYKGILLMRIYEARSYEAIVTTGDCSCANRAPPWDAAEAEYRDDFASLDPEGQQRATSDFRQLKDRFYRDARAVCREQGNW